MPCRPVSLCRVLCCGLIFFPAAALGHATVQSRDWVSRQASSSPFWDLGREAVKLPAAVPGRPHRLQIVNLRRWSTQRGPLRVACVPEITKSTYLIALFSLHTVCNRQKTESRRVRRSTPSRCFSIVFFPPLVSKGGLGGRDCQRGWRPISVPRYGRSTALTDALSIATRHGLKNPGLARHDQSHGEFQHWTSLGASSTRSLPGKNHRKHHIRDVQSTGPEVRGSHLPSSICCAIGSPHGRCNAAEEKKQKKSRSPTRHATSLISHA